MLQKSYWTPSLSPSSPYSVLGRRGIMSFYHLIGSPEDPASSGTHNGWSALRSAGLEIEPLPHATEHKINKSIRLCPCGQEQFFRKTSQWWSENTDSSPLMKTTSGIPKHPGWEKARDQRIGRVALDRSSYSAWRNQAAVCRRGGPLTYPRTMQQEPRKAPPKREKAAFLHTSSSSGLLLHEQPKTSNRQKESLCSIQR